MTICMEGQDQATQKTNMADSRRMAFLLLALILSGYIGSGVGEDVTLSEPATQEDTDVLHDDEFDAQEDTDVLHDDEFDAQVVTYVSYDDESVEQEDADVLHDDEVCPIVQLDKIH